VERTAILGASLGGWYALDFAIKRPGRVSAISLLTTAGVGPQKAGAFALSLFLAAVRLKGEKFVEETVFRGTGAPRELIEFQYLVALHFKPLLARLPVFGDADLRRLSMPLQYFGGEADGFVDTRKTAARLSAFVPDAEINVLEGTGHLIFNETGKAADFLARAVSAR
jgi:pimeloyl-ACP methyl ester carboxylesterase